MLVVSSAVYSQNITKKETINQFLCKTWVVDYGMMNGLKIEKLGQMKALIYSFKADNTYTLNGQTRGTWQYNAKKKSIELFQSNILRSTIVTLQSKKIVMTLNSDKSAPKEVSKLEIYFSPKG